MYFWLLCYGNALNCHFVYLALPGTRPLFMRKQKKVCFINMQLEKMKFISVHINMKQVSHCLFNIYKLWVFYSFC